MSRWRFKHSDDVGPVPPDGAIVEVVGEAEDDEAWPGVWRIVWQGEEYLAWWYELTPAYRRGAVWRTE